MVNMEETRRKIRIFLFCVVMCAVLAGVIYYFTDMYGKNDASEGTLVKGISFEDKGKILSENPKVPYEEM